LVHVGSAKRQAEAEDGLKLTGDRESVDLVIDRKEDGCRKEEVSRSMSTLALGLPDLFKRLHNFLYTNSNIPRAERLGAEMVRLLFCKIYDELNGMSLFRLTQNDTPQSVSRRLREAFEKVKQRFPDTFMPNEVIHLDDKSIYEVVRMLQPYRLLAANRDAISEAIHAFYGPSLRGEKGQFFTPSNVVRMCVKILDPRSGERIIDPACGSGSFLVASLTHVGMESAANIYGIDKEIDMVKISKTYLALIGGEYRNIYCLDSLAPHRWDSQIRQIIADASFDVVLTNPPFGAKIPIKDRDILMRYNLGYIWRSNGKTWVRIGTTKPQPPQVLFIERCLQLLRPGGRMAIVLPDGLLGNSRDRYIWHFVFTQARVTAVISLPPETFLPSTHTKTSVVVLEKVPDKPEEKYPIFMAIVDRVGHDKNGKPLFKLDDNGQFVFDEFGQRIIDDELPIVEEKFRDFKNGNLKPDDFDRLGFIVQRQKLRDHILVPQYYNPETEREIERLSKSGRYVMITIGELVKRGVLSIKRGHEVGSIYYGRGPIPFVRTTDIVNWEVKIDPVKGLPEEIYERFRRKQDIRPNDILLITDGTFLIGRTALVTEADGKMVIQSHIRRIRCLKPHELHPYLLLYLLNTKLVQQQIKDKTFVQATISTVGERLLEIVLPIPKDREEQARIIAEVGAIIELKKQARTRIAQLLDRPLS
jgi:type I restriction enzyme M protein